jgi:hypothetical protein
MAYLGLLIAGVLLCNSLPHLLAGVQGERFYTPWARPRSIGKSTALENVLWGSANLLMSVFLIDRIFPRNLPHGLLILAIGFVGMGIGLALIFGRRNAQA